MDNKQLTQTEIKKIADELNIMEVQLQGTMEKIRALRRIIIPDENGKSPKKKTQKQLIQNSIEKYYAKRRARALKNHLQ